MTHTPRIVAVAATLLLSSTAFATTSDFSKIDANADGKITLEEGMKLHPDWTAESFKALDKDGDGALSQAEYDTAASAPAATTTQSTDTNTKANSEASNTTDATSKTNAAPAPGDTTASTTAATE